MLTSGRFLRAWVGALALCCATALPSVSMGQGASPAAVTGASAAITARNLTSRDFPRWQQLEPNVYAYEGLHSSGINTVSLIVVTDEGVVVADGQGDLAQTRLMIENIGKWTTQPIKYVVVASDHTDHVGGNAAFKEAFPDVTFIASPVSQERLAKSSTPVVMAVSEQRSLRLGGVKIEVLNLGRAHTGGDLVVWLPDTNVVFLGEVYLRGVFPAMRSAYPSEWLATIRKAQAMNAAWYVPGHGFIDGAADLRRDLEQSRRALGWVIEEAQRLHKAGFACPAANDCPALAHADWGSLNDWALRDSQAPMAIWKVYQELEGKLP
ncbi:MBL fold metallo-hydrolase [Povalibacter sp.]|uniref:MBL fold metallo-hydrolase n=1 Tax=Povalibacter sp. TaxID=1962978 RepID=UPI002F3E2F36